MEPKTSDFDIISNFFTELQSQNSIKLSPKDIEHILTHEPTDSRQDVGHHKTHRPTGHTRPSPTEPTCSGPTGPQGYSGPGW